ncbi:MAG: glycosyltransferase family 2 protein [Bifidobacteriaceae bacterium]|jgi:glycosyltransferase involved in cell wall biosynthesis|nr:glycosyltransferase family 2 protein [Bifidobacteriaceae bacterium]
MEITADVSVVITCFNQGKTIARAVHSACVQSLPPMCITVVDDGSSDLITHTVLDNLADPDAAVSTERTGIPLRVIHQGNAGVSAARNAGIDAATGGIIAVLDGDDFWEPDFLEKTCTALLTITGAVAASSWLQTFGVLSTVVKPTGGKLAQFLSRNCCPASCVFRKHSWQTAGGYDTSLRSGFEDWDFSLRLLEDTTGTEQPSIATVTEPLLNYHTAPASTNITSMDHRLELMRTLISQHLTSYRDHVAEAVLGVEAISMRRMSSLEALTAQTPDAPALEPSFGDGGMAAAVRLASRPSSHHHA